MFDQITLSSGSVFGRTVFSILSVQLRSSKFEFKRFCKVAKREFPIENFRKILTWTSVSACALSDRRHNVRFSDRA